jgi:hypothetical protein
MYTIYVYGTVNVHVDKMRYNTNTETLVIKENRNIPERQFRSI